MDLDDEPKETLDILKPQELIIDLQTFKAIPNVNDDEEDEEDAAKLSKGFEFVMDKIQEKVNEQIDEDKVKSNLFLEQQQNLINYDIM